MYDTGAGVPQDDTEAVRWFRLAADQGNASAQVNLGVMYDTGAGVPQDDTEAVRWFRLAADQGVASAQYNLGFMYSNGAGVPEDDTEAVRWYRLAADQGHARAQLNLGVSYWNGEGTPQDFVEAHLPRISDLTVVLVATRSVVTPESYVVFRRPHFLGAAVRARRQTPEIEETGMLSRQAAVESRRRPGTEADPSTVAVGRALLNSEAITEAIRAIRRARSAHGTGTRSRRMQTINPAHNRI